MIVAINILILWSRLTPGHKITQVVNYNEFRSKLHDSQTINRKLLVTLFVFDTICLEKAYNSPLFVVGVYVFLASLSSLLSLLLLLSSVNLPAFPAELWPPVADMLYAHLVDGALLPSNTQTTITALCK